MCRTGILSECHTGHRTNITGGPVALMYPNRDIRWLMFRGKDTTLGTAARRHITYPLGFRCPLLRPFPQAHLRRTIWAAIITMGPRCIHPSITTHLRCPPVTSRARRKDLKGYRHTPRNPRTATMAKANPIPRPIPGLLFLAHINSMTRTEWIGGGI